jgi:mycofactocin system glycosyltransferase
VRTIVVDDASPDAEPIARIAQTHSATLLRLPVNSGPAAARNHGLRQVHTPYVAFCDADTVATSTALEYLLRHFHDHRVAVAAPRITGLEDDRSTNWIARYEAVRSSLDLGATSGVVRPHATIGWIPSACLVARVGALQTGFDESMRMGEDVDLVWRLAAQGWLIRYDAEITVAHEHRHSARAWLGRKYHYGTSAADLAKRHGSAVAPAVLAPAFAAMNTALVLQRRWSLAVALGTFALQTLRLQRQLGPIDGRPTLALELCARGSVDSLKQTSRLLTRTWLPMTALIALKSTRARRASLLVFLTDSGIDWIRRRPDLDIARFTIARRLEDAADGIGAWTGAWRRRSINCLTPKMQTAPRRSERSGHPSDTAGIAPPQKACQ